MKNPTTPFAILGEEGIRTLVSTFYDLMDSEATYSELRKMHAADLSPMKEKLSEYLIGWMGGPPLYAQKYGTVCMTEPHTDYAIGPRQRDLWLACFKQALEVTDTSEELKQMLEGPIFQVADMIRNREQSDSKLAADPNIIATSHN